MMTDEEMAQRIALGWIQSLTLQEVELLLAADIARFGRSAVYVARLASHGIRNEQAKPLTEGELLDRDSF